MPINQGVYGPETSSSAATDWTKMSRFDPSNQFNTPPKTPTPLPEQQGGVDPLGGPGSITGDITDPLKTAESLASESLSVADGVRRVLFGTSVEDLRGKHNGVFGDIPIVGDVGRAVGDVNAAIGNFAMSVPGHVADAVGGALEHVSGGVDTGLEAKFNAIGDQAIKDEALAAIEADSHGDKGMFTAAAHYMSRAIEQWEEENGKSKPNLWDNIFVENTSLADTFTNMFGVLGATQRGAERLWAGLDTPGQGDMNRLEVIMAVGDGRIAFNEDKGVLGTGLLAGGGAGLNEVEQLVYTKVNAGEWSETEALDYLASHGAGLSHAASMEVLGSLAVDPLNAASLGAGALAKAGVTGVRLLRVERAAQEMLEAASTAGDVNKINEAKSLLDIAQSGLRSGDDVGRLNALGKVATTKWSGDTLRKFGVVYEAMSDTSVGKIAKATRTIIDPFHLWGDSPRLDKVIREGSVEVARIAARTHGEANHGAVIYMLGASPAIGKSLVDDFEAGIAITLANDLRRVASRRYQAVQAWRGTLRELRADPTIKGVRDAMKNVTKEVITRVEEEVTSFIKYDWTDDDLVNLAERATAMFDGRTKDEWLAEFRSADRWNNERLSLMHRATYGLAVRKLHRARKAVRDNFETGLWADRLEDIILLNRNTLTDIGAQGIEKRLDDATTVADQLAEIAVARRRYPELRNFVSDPTSPQRTIDGFREHLNGMKQRLPHQIENSERPQLPASLAEFDSLITTDPQNGVFTLALRPKQEFLWGIEEDMTGVLRVVSDPWFDQVSDVTDGVSLERFHGVREMSYSASGIPMPVKAGARILDYGEMAGRTLFRGVTGKMVTQAAHKKFLASVYKQVGDSGVSEAQVEKLWDALREAVDVRVAISGMRGLSKHDMWAAARTVTHDWPHAAKYGPRELMLDVLKAYEGDLRTVGVTQKMTGRVKTMLADFTDRNFAGEISEHVWPLLKFRLNPFFQVQEKIEPWVLNGWRGANVAGGRTPNDLDRMTAAIYKRYLDSSLVNMADQDIAELSAKFAIGSELEILSMDRATAIGHIKSKLTVDAILDVQGTKRLNMLRTFRKGLGDNMRASWDRHKAGEWDKLVAHYSAERGLRLGDDDVAVLIMNENLAANDVFVKAYRDADGNIIGWDADFENAITTGWEAAPQHIGELRPLDMERMVRRISLTGADGQLITNEVELRRALATGEVTWDQVARELNDLNANPDYINRVHNNLSFNWNKFWSDVKASFRLSDNEERNLRTYFAVIAERRGMTPAEYLSQIYAPGVSRSGDALVGTLGSTVDFMRNNGLATLVATPGVSYSGDFYKQMANVVVAHLDPSAKRAFLIAAIGTSSDPGPLHSLFGNAILDNIADIDDMFETYGIDEFANRLMGFYQGRPPTGTGRVVDATELPELSFIREASANRLIAQNRAPRGGDRMVIDTSDDLRTRGAAAYDGLTSFMADPNPLPYRITQQGLDVRMRDSVRPGRYDQTLKPAARSLPTPIANAYMDYVKEVRSLYRYIVDDLKISVRPRTVAYSSADELRTDLSRISGRTGGRLPRVYVSTEGLNHPVLTAEDEFMVRTITSVFGHGQEATQFGDDAATMSAAAVFPDSVRGVFLSDNWARGAWESHSQNVIPAAPPRPSNVDEYVARYGDILTDTNVQVARNYTVPTRSVGDGARAIGNDPVLGPDLFGTLADLRTAFPGVPFANIEVYDHPGAGAVTYVSSTGETPSIQMSTTAGWVTDEAARLAIERRRNIGRGLGFRNQTAEFGRSGRNVTVQTPGNTPALVGSTRVSDLYHEWGHVIDSYLHKLMHDARELHNADPYNVPIPFDDFGYTDPAFQKFMKDLRDGEVRKRISGYANVTYGNPGVAFDEADLMAELTDLAINPEYNGIINLALERQKVLKARAKDPNDAYDGLPPGKTRADMEASLGRPLKRYESLYDPDYTHPHSVDPYDPTKWEDRRFWFTDGRLDTELLSTVVQYREHLKRMGIWKPDNVVGRNPYAGMTVAEINAAADAGLPMTRRVPLDALDAEPGQHELLPENVNLYAAMTDVGQQAPPITVESNGRIKDGHHRFAAHQQVGKPDILATLPAPQRISAPVRVGALPNDLVEELGRNYLGTGRYAESNPDVARIANYARQTMNDAASSFFSDIGHDINSFSTNMPYSYDESAIFGPAGLDKVNAVPFDYSQSLLWDAAVQGMAAKWEDAFRLQYFAQNRSMLQRSINHPMFGLYPASYMWGKIMPELIKFIALTPFGMNTGVGARMLGDVQMSVAMQRENDPEFDKHIESLGHSASIDFLSYMLPATPWEVPSSYPGWLRSFAKQGLQMEKDATSYKASEDIDWVAPFTSVVKKAVPLTTQIPWMGRVVEELSGGGPPPKNTRAYKVWLAEQIQKRQQQEGATPVPQQEEPGTPPPDLSAPTPAASLTPVLDNSLDQLKVIFGQ